MRITAKGQVTIPVEVRERLGLLPETEVQFVVEDDSARLVKGPPSPHTRGGRLVRQLREHAGPGMTTDEILALTRDP